mmetsp:Transcript_68444/g.108688  ORF Transcript_68444/g.108688 Transcript_68444/m.108688 type:complete len:244 (+) Transcript_68444:136-867(+)
MAHKSTHTTIPIHHCSAHCMDGIHDLPPLESPPNIFLMPDAASSSAPSSPSSSLSAPFISDFGTCSFKYSQLITSRLYGSFSSFKRTASNKPFFSSFTLYFCSIFSCSCGSAMIPPFVSWYSRNHELNVFLNSSLVMTVCSVNFTDFIHSPIGRINIFNSVLSIFGLPVTPLSLKSMATNNIAISNKILSTSSASIVSDPSSSNFCHTLAKVALFMVFSMNSLNRRALTLSKVSPSSMYFPAR